MTLKNQNLTADDTDWTDERSIAKPQPKPFNRRGRKGRRGNKSSWCVL